MERQPDLRKNRNSQNYCLSEGIEGDEEEDTTKDSVDFPSSTFFQTLGRRLPEPSHIKSLPSIQSGAKIVTIPALQLVVKYGRHVTIDEAVTMRWVRKKFGDKVPVPEVYGWRNEDAVVFLYMEQVRGVELQKCWGSLGVEDKERMCSRVGEMVGALRGLRHRGESFIGSITRGPLLDRAFYERPKVGPMETLAQFYKRLEWILQQLGENPSEPYHDPYLALMPKDSSIRFTHADVHPTNIIVSAPAAAEAEAETAEPPRVLALIDWGQAGWYPDYWEYFKMCYSTDEESEWRATWIPRMVEPREYESYLLSEYVMNTGGV